MIAEPQIAPTKTDHNAGISDDDGDDRHELSGTGQVHICPGQYSD